MEKTRILIVDDHTILRQGIARLLNAELDFEANLASGSIGEALLIIAAGLADVVLLDIDLGTERGTDFLTLARRNGFQGPVVVLTAGIPREEQTVLENQGVSAVLLKDSSVDQLANRIRAAMGRTRPVMTNWDGESDTISAVIRKPFTPRETKVLRMVVEGLASKEIAGELESTEPIVKSVIQQLFRKTGTRTRAQLVRAALEQHRGEW